MAELGAMTLLIVDISPVSTVVISPPAVVAGMLGGGGDTTVVDISPAKAESARMIINTNAAQSCLRYFIWFSSRGFLVLELGVFALIGCAGR
jgi:hypothetical protein